MFGHWLATISHPVAVQVPAGAPQSPAFATQKKRGGHGTGKMCKKNTRFFGSFKYCNGVIYIYIYQLSLKTMKFYFIFKKKTILGELQEFLRFAKQLREFGSRM
jgi:hypothetical protein